MRRRRLSGGLGVSDLYPEFRFGVRGLRGEAYGRRVCRLVVSLDWYIWNLNSGTTEAEMNGEWSKRRKDMR